MRQALSVRGKSKKHIYIYVYHFAKFQGDRDDAMCKLIA